MRERGSYIAHKYSFELQKGVYDEPMSGFFRNVDTRYFLQVIGIVIHYRGMYSELSKLHSFDLNFKMLSPFRTSTAVFLVTGCWLLCGHTCYYYPVPCMS